MRRFLFSLVVTVVLFFIGSVAEAGPPASQPTTSPVLDPTVQKAVDAGIKYIVSKQNKDGSVCDGEQERTAITSLAIMALHSYGVQMSQHTPAAAALRKAIAWVLQDARLRPDGYFGTDGSMMYTHGVTTLMLAQMAGAGADAGQNALIKTRLTKAVELILEAQKNNQLGAWRYRPDSSDGDVGVTAWQVRALAAARQAGIAVPQEAFSNAADFIKSCAADLGGFAYLPGGKVRWSCSATGLLALQLCGQGNSPEAKSALDYLQARPQPADRVWYLYACPAYVMALGASGSEDLENARATVAQALMQFQQKDGSWTGWDYDNQHGLVYCTSLVILSQTAKPPAHAE